MNNKSSKNNDKIETEVREKVTIIEKHLEIIFNGIFVHRYRDVDSSIRAFCIEMLGKWIRLYQELFLDNSYLRYIGWMLSDRSCETRLASIKSIIYILDKSTETKKGNEGIIKYTRAFIERFKDRILEIGVRDKESSCQIASMSLIELLIFSGLIEDDAMKEIYVSCFGYLDVKVQKAVGSIIGKIVKKYAVERIKAAQLLLSQEDDTSFQPEIISKDYYFIYKSLADWIASLDLDVKTLILDSLIESLWDEMSGPLGTWVNIVEYSVLNTEMRPQAKTGELICLASSVEKTVWFKIVDSVFKKQLATSNSLDKENMCKLILSNMGVFIDGLPSDTQNLPIQWIATLFSETECISNVFFQMPDVVCVLMRRLECIYFGDNGTLFPILCSAFKSFWCADLDTKEKNGLLCSLLTGLSKEIEENMGIITIRRISAFLDTFNLIDICDLKPACVEKIKLFLESNQPFKSLDMKEAYIECKYKKILSECPNLDDMENSINIPASVQVIVSDIKDIMWKLDNTKNMLQIISDIWIVFSRQKILPPLSDDIISLFSKGVSETLSSSHAALIEQLSSGRVDIKKTHAELVFVASFIKLFIHGLIDIGEFHSVLKFYGFVQHSFLNLICTGFSAMIEKEMHGRLDVLVAKSLIESYSLSISIGENNDSSNTDAKQPELLSLNKFLLSKCKSLKIDAFIVFEFFVQFIKKKLLRNIRENGLLLLKIFRSGWISLPSTCTDYHIYIEQMLGPEIKRHKGKVDGIEHYNAILRLADKIEKRKEGVVMAENAPNDMAGLQNIDANIPMPATDDISTVDEKTLYYSSDRLDDLNSKDSYMFPTSPIVRF